MSDPKFSNKLLRETIIQKICHHFIPILKEITVLCLQPHVDFMSLTLP